MRYLTLIFILGMCTLVRGNLQQEMLSSIASSTELVAPSQNPSSAESPPPELPQPEISPIAPPFSYSHSFMKMLFALAGMIVLLWIAIRLLRRIGQGHFRGLKNNKIKVIEKKPLSPKSILYLVDVDGKRMVIAESQWEVRLMTSLDDLEKPS